MSRHEHIAEGPDDPVNRMLHERPRGSLRRVVSGIGSFARRSLNSEGDAPDVYYAPDAPYEEPVDNSTLVLSREVDDDPSPPPPPIVITPGDAYDPTPWIHPPPVPGYRGRY